MKSSVLWLLAGLLLLAVVVSAGFGIDEVAGVIHPPLPK